jgi:hypothetical protein
MNDLAKSDHRPTWIELEAVKPLPEASLITSLSSDTLMRHYSEYIVQLSPRRLGMKLRNILAITNQK